VFLFLKSMLISKNAQVVETVKKYVLKVKKFGQ